MLYTRDQVMAFLPHREPFLFIDSVDSIQAVAPSKGHTYTLKELIGAELEATFVVHPEMPMFQGHFPGRPILPGVIHIEIMGQASCFIISKLFDNPFQIAIETTLASVSHCKFRRPVYPGDILRVHSRLDHVRGMMMTYDCHIECMGHVVSEATILAQLDYTPKNTIPS